MTASADSTLAPSRRAFFAHAVASGVAATRPPIFTVPPLADAAIIALGPIILGLVAARDALAEYQAAVEQRSFDYPTEEHRHAEIEADAAYDAADGRVLAVSREMAAMRATTLDGLIMKARMGAAGGDDHALGQSIVADLLAMA